MGTWGRRRSVGLWLVALLLGVWGACTPREPAHALELEVASHTWIDLNIEALGRRPILRGRLMDNVNQGVAGATVWLRVFRQGGSQSGRRDGAILERGIQTDALGYFKEAVLLPDGAYLAVAAFDGGEQSFYVKSDAQQTFDVGLWASSLVMEAPALVNLDGTGKVTATIKAEVQIPKGVRLPDEPLSVALSGLPARETQATQESVSLVAPTLAAELSLDAQQITERGLQVLTARFAGNDYIAPAQAEASMRLFTKPTMELHGQIVRESERRGVVLSGTATSAEGPLPGARLWIEYSPDDGRSDTWTRTGEMRSGDDGTFSGFLDEETLPEGRMVFRLRLVPDAGPTMNSPSVTLEIESSGVGTWAPWILGGSLGLFAVGGGLIYGLRRFTAWLNAAWSARRAWKPGRDQGARIAKPIPLENPPEELIDHPKTIGGRVFDELDGDPLAGARLVLLNPQGEPALAEAHTDARGCFVMTDLPTGKHTLQLSLHGYVTARVGLSIPHDGSLRYFRVNMIPVRQHVRDRYVWLLAQYSPKKGLWGAQTPQEVQRDMLLILNQLSEPHAAGELWPSALLETLRQRLDQPQIPWTALLQALTALLEEVYFSERRYPEALLSQVDRLCERLQRPLADLRKQRQGAAAGAVGRSRSERSAAQEAGRG